MPASETAIAKHAAEFKRTLQRVAMTPIPHLREELTAKTFRIVGRVRGTASTHANGQDEICRLLTSAATTVGAG